MIQERARKNLPERFQRLDDVHTNFSRIGSRSGFGFFRGFTRTLNVERALGPSALYLKQKFLLLACALSGLEEGLPNTRILIILDSQIALLVVKSRLVWEYAQVLDRLTPRNIMILRWISGCDTLRDKGQ